MRLIRFSYRQGLKHRLRRSDLPDLPNFQLQKWPAKKVEQLSLPSDFNAGQMGYSCNPSLTCPRRITARGGTINIRRQPTGYRNGCSGTAAFDALSGHPQTIEKGKDVITRSICPVPRWPRDEVAIEPSSP